MKWIESNGGPLVLLDEHLLELWKGVGDAEWSPGSGTDYDRACSIEGYLGRLKVSDGEALVLGDEPMPTCALAGDFGAVLVRWVYGPADWEPDVTSVWAEQEWTFESNWVVHCERQALQGAAFGGADEHADRLWLALSPGAYEVLSSTYRREPEVEMILHWIRLSG